MALLQFPQQQGYGVNGRSQHLTKKRYRPKIQRTLSFESFLWNLTHIYSLVVKSPGRAVGKGGDAQADRFHGENQLMIQVVKHDRLRKNIFGGDYADFFLSP